MDSYPEEVQTDLAKVIKITSTKAGPVEYRNVQVVLQEGYWLKLYKFNVFNDNPSFEYMKLDAKLLLKVSKTLAFKIKIKTLLKCF